MGAIFMANNTTTTKRTKQIDIKIHFVNENVDEEIGQMKIVLVKYEDNKSDVFTKNVAGDTMKNHTEDYLGEKEEIKK